MSKNELAMLSKRERQIMDFIYAQGRATAGEVHLGIPDAPSYSAVRALLKVLLDKGHLRHEKDGAKYVYFPTSSRQAVAVPALKRVVNTFFEGSLEKAVAALMNVNGDMPTNEQLDQLQMLIDNARKNGSQK